MRRDPARAGAAAVSVGVFVRAARRLGHDLVDDAQGELLGRGQAHRHGRLLRGVGAAPQDAGARPPG